MLKRLFFLAFVLAGVATSSHAQVRQIVNNNPCNHVVIIEWVDMACAPLPATMAFTTHSVGPGMTINVIGPGGPFSMAYQMFEVYVDNTGTTPGIVGNPMCGGVPIVITGVVCANDIILNPGADVTIN